MKKLKVLLIVLLAGLMSLALFACKKGGETNNPGGETPGGETPGGETPGETPGNTGDPEPTGNEIVAVRAVDPIEFTESATADDLATALAKIEVSIRTSEETSRISGSDCTVEDAANIQWGTVGSYNVNLLPTENNPREYFARLTVNIVHDFDNDGVCEDCQATISTDEIGEDGTPETVKFIAFHNDGHTLTAGDKSFVTRYETAPTYTPGRLTKGTKIVLKGTAKTNDAEGATWNFPVVGFADSSTGDYDYGAATGTGSSVLIRNDSWILYNGIGTPRMLGGIAGGTSEAKNYGSTVEGTNQPADYLDWTEGTRYSEGVPYTTANWKDWYVYSTGDPLYSQDYLEEADVEITWEYRYDGVIVVSICTNEDTTLTSYTKVPDNNQGYYDAILHGELMTYKLTSITVTNPLTLTDMQVTATPKQNQKSYLANQMLNFGDVTVQAKYQQKGDAWQNVDQFEVYGMVEGAGAQTMTVDDATYTGALYNLSNSALLSTMTRYFVVLSVGKTTKTLTYAAEDFVGVYGNAVDSIQGLIVGGVESFVNDASGADAYTHTGEGNVTIKLTGYAGTASDDAIADYFPDTTDTHFIVFAVNTKAGGDKFTTPSTAQSGMLKGDRYMIMIDPDGSQLQVIITMKKGDLPDIEIEGLQDGKIKFDLSGISGVDATAAITLPENFALNEGGEATVVYEFAAGTVDNTTMWTVSYAGGSAAMFRFTGTIPAAGTRYGNVTLMSATDKDGNAITNWAEATSLKLTFKVAGISLNAAVGDYVIQLVKGGTNVLSRAMFTYNGMFNDNVAGDKGAVIEVSDDESSVGTRSSWYAQRVGDKLYLAKVFWDEWVTESDIVVTDFTLNFNAGDPDGIVYFDLSGKMEYGTYVFNDNQYNDEDYEGMTVALYYNEYDFGNFATLVFAIDLSELEDQGVEGVYNFVHTDIYEDGDDYFYYSATANGVEIKTVEKTATGKSDVDPGCEQAGAKLTGIKSGEEFTFLLHVDFTPQHNYEKDANEFYVCEDDGAILWSGDATNVNVKASYFQALIGDEESLVDTGLTVSFAMQGVNQALADWNATVLSTITGGMLITTPNLDCWGASAGKNGTTEMTALATKLAQANVYPGFNGNDNLQNSYAWDAFLGEKCYVTIVISKTEGISYYRNGELAIRYNPDDYLNRGNTGNVDEDVNAQVKQFAELFLLLTETYGLRLGTGSTLTSMEDVLFEARTADDDACELLYLNYNRSANFYPADSEKGGIYSENQTPSTSEPLVVDADGYTGTNPLWIGRPIEYGKVVTFTGTMESTGDQVFYLPILNLFSGDSAAKGSMFRLDGWWPVDIIEQGTVPTFVSVTLDGTETTVNAMANPTWKQMLAANPATEIKISWLNAAKITVTFKMTATISDVEHVAMTTFELASVGEAFTQTSFNIGLGGEKMTYTITSITREDGDLHVHQYSEVDDRCPEDGALNPEHVHSYDPTTERCKCGEINPEHVHSYTNGVCPIDDVACMHPNVSGGVCADCSAHIVDDVRDITVNNSNFWQNGQTTVDINLVKSGQATMIAQYTEFTQTGDKWGGAMFAIKFNGGVYKFRYIDGAYIGANDAWNTAYAGQTVTIGGDYAKATHAEDALPGTRMKVLATYSNEGTVVITITQYAADDTEMETVLATRTITITGLTDTVLQFGVSSGDGSAFVDNKVATTSSAITWESTTPDEGNEGGND